MDVAVAATTARSVERTGRRRDQHRPTRLARLLAADATASRWLHCGPGRRLGRGLLLALELSGHGVLWISGTALAAVACARAPDRHEATLRLLMALLLDVAVVGLLKIAVRRARPAYNRDDMRATVSLDRFSFPSGHSSRAVLLLVLAAHRLLGPTCAGEPGAVLGLLAATLWAASVAASRVLLGRHYAGDVAAGAVLGAVLGAAALGVGPIAAGWWPLEPDAAWLVRAIADRLPDRLGGCLCAVPPA